MIVDNNNMFSHIVFIRNISSNNNYCGHGGHSKMSYFAF